MLSQIFAIRDVKVSVYNQPFFAPDAISATRIFTMATRDTNTRINNFPEDFELYQLGTYDDITAKFTTDQQPKFIINAQTLINMDMAQMIKNRTAQLQQTEGREHAEGSDSTMFVTQK